MLTYTQVLFLLVVPPALVLAFLTRPIVGKMEVYKLLALVAIAFVYSTPWYLNLIFIFRLANLHEFEFEIATRSHLLSLQAFI
jgi:hypothetical protein